MRTLDRRFSEMSNDVEAREWHEYVQVFKSRPVLKSIILGLRKHSGTSRRRRGEEGMKEANLGPYHDPN